MEIWNYHPRTGELLGPSMADPDSMAPGEWLIPAHATTTPPGPPLGPGRVYLFNGTSWEPVTDCRGQTWWRADAELNTEPFRIDFLGDPAEQGFTDVEPPAPPVIEPPVFVSPRQIRLALTQLGWRVGLENYVAAGSQDEKDVWQFASKFERGGLVNDVLTSLGKTQEEIDEIFALAKTL